ncbi:hypothetical protein B296_00031488 [Ensete ventricosum]|uniref:Uncharacterized protein n=1 Tax=Ensete ventricosum TaxID=4639 RepID=A0A427A5M4_ENSVE|nr:hypothetical protein B296_00031488 [Ensete ventricosum]
MDTDRKLVWDCGSSLYDSFELKSFMRQLDSAVATRCMSMPHLSETPPRAPAPSEKKRSRFSRSVQKLLRSVLRIKSMFRVQLQSHGHQEQALHAAYLLSGRLESIPEVSEKETASPEIDIVVRKTVSERFTASTVKPLTAIS